MFIDDLNLPQPDTFGSTPVLEYLRQLVDRKAYLIVISFYDIKNLNEIFIRSCSFLCLCSTEGPRQKISHRIKRHFYYIYWTSITDEELNSIFGQILTSYLAKQGVSQKQVGLLKVESLVKVSIDIYRKMCQQLLPTPQKSHYIFDTSNMAKLYQGLIQVLL